MRKLVLSLGLTLSASFAHAAGIVDARVEGNRLTAAIELPGGLEADLSVSFEQVVGLNAASVGLSAEVVSPLNLGVLGRLPAGVRASAAL